MLGEAIALEGRLAGGRVLDVGCGTGNGMVAMAIHHGCHVVGVFDREDALARLRGRAYSTLDLLDEAEYRTGLDHGERELPPTIEYTLQWIIAVAERA